MGTDSVLSQDAIDALLNGASDSPVDSGAQKSAVRVQDKPVPAPQTAPDTSSADTPSGSQFAGITRDEAIEIAGEAAEAESLTIQMTMERMAKRLDSLESATQRIADLEEEIEWLRKSM
jgi:hypothetical protein